MSGSTDDMANIIGTIQKLSSDSCGYKIVLMGVSVICVVLYIYRYKKVSQILPQRHSEDLRSLTTVMIGLCLWNFVISAFTGSILLNLDGIRAYLGSQTNIPRDFRGYFINEHIYSVLNTYFLKKDMRIFIVTIMSMISFHIFSNVILKCVEYISFISNLDEKDTEKIVAHSPVSKFVSFNNDLTTFQYLDVELSVSKSRLNMGQSLLRTHAFKHCITFVIFVIISYCIVPDIFLFNSSAIIVQYSSLTLKSDHAFYAVFSMFVLDVAVIFFNVANHPKIRNFPHFTSILSRFIWCYSSLILASSMGLMILFNDLLINLVKLVAIYSSTPGNTLNYHVLFITQIFIKYLTHSVQLYCIASGDCSQLDLVKALSENFIWLKNILTSCCIVLNLSCFVILPLLIWIVIIESKLGRFAYKSF